MLYITNDHFEPLTRLYLSNEFAKLPRLNPLFIILTATIDILTLLLRRPPHTSTITTLTTTMPKRLTSLSSSYPPLSPSMSNPPTPTIPSTFTDTLPLPHLIVFDLDYTLWPFWVDTHVSPPLKPRDNNTRMVDRYNESFTFYPDVPFILSAARSHNITLGLASRTHMPDLARDMLRGLVISTSPENEKDKRSKPQRAIDFFTPAYQQIFPGSKVTHFQKIQDASRKQGKEIAFADMLFFDDESRNRNVEAQLGVTFCQVRDGVTNAEMDRGVWEWRIRRGVSRPAREGAVEMEA